ncbi:MAG: hypothetical protein U5M53_07400 [Rhodoferax sp.]|nr:hypothetical protein [Rhodoferax sp.]
MSDDETNTVTIGCAAAAVGLFALRSSNAAMYNAVKGALRDHTIVMPPSGAVAGCTPPPTPRVACGRHRPAWTGD